MDAARIRIGHLAFLLPAVLLAVVPAAAQIAVSTDTINLTPIKQSDTFTVSSTGAAVNFTVALPNGVCSYSVSPTSSNTTAGPVTVTVTLTNVGPGFNGSCVNTLTVTNFGDANDKKTVTVNYSNSAGTSSISANPTTINLSVLTNNQTTSGTSTLSTSSISPVSSATDRSSRTHS